MDINETLRELREITATENDRTEPIEAYAAIEALGRFAELFDALDVWLTRGGFTPDAWRS